MSAAEGEPEGIGAKADIILDAVAAIIEQPVTPRSSFDLKSDNLQVEFGCIR